MNINIHDPNQLLRHVLLHDTEVVKMVADTENWKKGVIEATVFINGVEVPAYVLEDVLQNVAKKIEESVREKYDADQFDVRVKEASEEKLKGTAQKALSAANEFARQVECLAGDIWED